MAIIQRHWAHTDTAADRLARYRDTLRCTGLKRAPDFDLRVRAGLRFQHRLQRRPIPRHRALVVAGPLRTSAPTA